MQLFNNFKETILNGFEIKILWGKKLKHNEKKVLCENEQSKEFEMFLKGFNR